LGASVDFSFFLNKFVLLLGRGSIENVYLQKKIEISIKRTESLNLPIHDILSVCTLRWSGYYFSSIDAHLYKNFNFDYDLEKDI